MLLNVFAVFLQPYPIVALACCLAVFALLGYLCEEMQPCMTRRLNVWKAVSYWCPAIICVAGLLLELTSRNLAYIIVGVGFGFVFLRAWYLSKFYGRPRGGPLRQIVRLFKRNKVAPTIRPGHGMEISVDNDDKWHTNNCDESKSRKNSIDTAQIYAEGDEAMVVGPCLSIAEMPSVFLHVF